MIKAVYGTLLAAIIFYKKLSKHLRQHGFVCNNYDMCTFNKIVNGNQLMVQFHVDDLKASHHNPEVLKEFVNQLLALPLIPSDKFDPVNTLSKRKQKKASNNNATTSEHSGAF